MTKINVKISNKNNQGYAILFTIIIISAILAMGAGMSNTILKQLLLSSTARESQIAFYQADTAVECAIYAAEVKNLATLSSPWQCGLDSSGNPIDLNINVLGTDIYRLSVNMPFSGPCFSIDVDKSTGVTPPYTADIKARGYNVCDSTDIHQVERGIQVNY
jgi:hypothetical protein